MKKIVSFFLVLMLVLSMSATVFAASDGSITINNITAGSEYAIYKLLDLESFDKGSGAYSYKVNAAWDDFFTTGEGKNYVTIDSAGYVTWSAAEDDATVAAFAKIALAYAKANGIAPVKSSENPGDFVITGTTGKFSGLELGWYLIDSTAGALCGLTTTDKDAVINAKNHPPIIDKQVQEDLSGMWGDKNTADIGQIVNFMSIIHVAPGAQNYVMHDRMSNGLTFLHDTLHGRGVTEIKHITSGGVESVLVEGVDYNVVIGASSGCTYGCDFEVKFTEPLIAKLKANERIIIYYNAMLNRNAVIDGPNPNETKLEYGEDHYTEEDKTETYTFRFNIVKTDSSNQLISGAKFRIYDAPTGGNEIRVVQLFEDDDVTPKLDANGNKMYRRARADELIGEEIEVNDGVVTIVGFDNGVYYLEETEAPAGYNKLTSRVEFTISDSNLDAVFTSGIYSTGSGVHVVNRTGNMLPETGAMGTTLFITIGVIVVLGTGILLVTKKRMGMIQE